MATNLHKVKNNCVGLTQNNPFSPGGTNLIVDNTLDGKLSTLGVNFWLTLWHIGRTPDTDTQMEIVEVIARTSPNNYKVNRAQQGTTQQTFPKNSNVALLWTAGNAHEVLNDTEPVAEGTTIVYGSDNLPHLLAVGADGYALFSDSTQPFGVGWSNNFPASPKSVNADELISSAATSELPIGVTGTGITIYNNGFSLHDATTAGVQVQKTLLDANAANLQFAYAHAIRLKFNANLSTVAGTGGGGSASGNAIGFSDVNTGLLDPTSSVPNSIKICQTANLSGDIYFVTSDSVGNTHTDISGFATPGNPYVYEIIWKPGVSAVLYVNGAIAATHTTNIPNAAVTAKLWYYTLLVGAGPIAGISVVTPVISISRV